MVATGYRHCCLLKMLFWEAVFQTAFMAHISELNKNNKCHHQGKHENTGEGGVCAYFTALFVKMGKFEF